MSGPKKVTNLNLVKSDKKSESKVSAFLQERLFQN